MNRQISQSEYQGIETKYNYELKYKASYLNGEISRNEMYQLVTSLDLQVKDENELDYLIKQIDVDGDGQISFAEFLK